MFKQGLKQFGIGKVLLMTLVVVSTSAMAQEGALSIGATISNPDGSVTYVQPRFGFEGKDRRIADGGELGTCARLGFPKSLSATYENFMYGLSLVDGAVAPCCTSG